MNYYTNIFYSLLAVLLLASCSYEAEAILYYPEDGKMNFPESSLMENKDMLTGVCFSGGGTRALNCAIGQMKALDSLGLWEYVDYISSVSGGTWASSIFTYYKVLPDGPQNDKELLGYPVGAKGLTMKNLQEPIPTKHMTHVVTRDLTKHLEDLWLEDIGTLDLVEKANDIWVDAVGQTYLEPFGLYGQQEKFFTLDDESLGDILSRKENDHLKAENFLKVHAQEGDVKRPYLVMNSTVISPASFLPLKTPSELTVFNYSPLGVGAAKYREVTQKTRYQGKRTYPVGGSFIEPFAFGGTGPEDITTTGSKGNEQVTVELEKKHAFRLTDAVGTSSSAFAVVMAEYYDLEILSNVLAFGSLIPKEDYWTTYQNGQTREYTSAESYRYGDGGSLDNFGILSLLQRDVRKLLVFINTDTPIDSCFNPTLGTPDGSTIDYNFYTLFADYKYENHRNNQVFSKKDFVDVYNQFKEDLHNGVNPTAILKTTTIGNEWWGIDPMEVEVHFYYNSKSPLWESKLAPAIQDSIALGGDGPFPDFPIYRTVFPENYDLLVEFSPAMTKLLYEYQFWCVYHNREKLKFLKD